METNVEHERRAASPTKRSRGGTQPLPLTRDDILAAALPILAGAGIDGLTIKALADELGISSPAVYHYFSGREQLLDRLCEEVAAEVDLEIPAAMRWDDAVVAVVLNMDRTFARYPGVAARVLPARRRSRAADRISLAVKGLITEAGFAEEPAEELLASLHFVFGGWLLGRRPTLPERSTDPVLLERSVRWLLTGFAAAHRPSPRARTTT